MKSLAAVDWMAKSKKVVFCFIKEIIFAIVCSSAFIERSYSSKLIDLNDFSETLSEYASM